MAATIYTQFMAAPESRALSGVTPNATAQEMSVRLSQSESVSEFRHQLELQFQEAYGASPSRPEGLTREQVVVMAQRYTEAVLRLQIDSAVEIGNREGRSGHMEPVRVAMATINVAMQQAAQLGLSELATEERQYRYMHNLLEGTTPEVQMDALRAATNLGWSAIAIRATILDFNLPQAAQMQLQQTMAQHLRDLFSQFQQTVQDATERRLDESRRRHLSQDLQERHQQIENELRNNPTLGQAVAEDLRNDPEFRVIQHNLEVSTSSYFLTDQARRLTLEGRSQEGEHMALTNWNRLGSVAEDLRYLKQTPDFSRIRPVRLA